MDSTKLKQLLDCGQSYWLDNLTRDMIENGELKKRVEDEGLRGITSNPKTFGDSIRESDRYDADIKRLAGEGEDVETVYEALMVEDIQNACDILRPVYDESDGRDGFVSLEVDPRLARHTEATIEAARRLFQSVDRPNCMIKIPGTEEGLAAIETALFEGINVNITLLFSQGRYKEVVAAHQRALDRRRQAGKPVESVASVASFFLSRIDVLVDELIGHRHTKAAPNDLLAGRRGQLAIALARIVYREFEKDYKDSSAWQGLAADGAQPQRPLWASTGTKNPDDKPTKYIDPLIAPQTVSTMPEKTIEAFAESGTVAENAISESDTPSAQVIEDFAGGGIDLEYVSQRLEDEGIQKFIDPYEEAVESIREQIG
ncbi:MAG TPA: transaldolase [Opitutales bacterium]|nr:transaldolase [Opitutales bacterium]